MKFFDLRHSMATSGRTLFGLGSSTVQFIPAAHTHNFNPLFFQKKKGATALLLRKVTMKNRRMEATMFGSRIGAVEHYSPLRFLFPGLRFTSQHEELPHFTHVWPLAQKLLTNAVEVDVDVSFFTVEGACGWQYPKDRGGLDAWTFIEPNRDRTLRICVTVCFKGLGEKTMRFTFPDHQLLFKVFQAQSPGIPSWLEGPAKLLWSHAHDTYWPQKSECKEKVLEAIIYHRVQDILGAVALIDAPLQGGFPSLSISSQCSGHLADYKAINLTKVTPLK